MNMRPPGDDALDRFARELHETAVDHVAPSTLRRLRAQSVANRHHDKGEAPRGIAGWALASACAAVVALVAIMALPGRLPEGSLPSTERAAPLAMSTTSPVAIDAGTAILDEDPDFYLWLATTDVQPIAME